MLLKLFTSTRGLVEKPVELVSIGQILVGLSLEYSHWTGCDRHIVLRHKSTLHDDCFVSTSGLSVQRLFFPLHRFRWKG